MVFVLTAHPPSNCLRIIPAVEISICIGGESAASITSRTLGCRFLKAPPRVPIHTTSNKARTVPCRQDLPLRKLAGTTTSHRGGNCGMVHVKEKHHGISLTPRVGIVVFLMVKALKGTEGMTRRTQQDRVGNYGRSHHREALAQGPRTWKMTWRR